MRGRGGMGEREGEEGRKGREKRERKKEGEEKKKKEGEEKEGEIHFSSRSGFPKLIFHTGVTQPGSECYHVIS